MFLGRQVIVGGMEQHFLVVGYGSYIFRDNMTPHSGIYVFRRGIIWA
jgi:hypothetical protein